MPRERKPLNVGHLVSEYRAGRSVLDLAREFGVSRDTVTRRLMAADVALRSLSEQNVISFGRMSPAQRAAMTAAAHDAVRGVPRSFASKVRNAIAKQRTLAHIGPTEMRVMADLRSACIDPIPQLAVGPYNCDIAAYPVAVEVFGGHWHFSGRHLARAEERIRYLGDAGWHVLMVVVADRVPAYRYTDATSEHIIAYVKKARSDPSAPRQYRVIGCRGQTLAAGRCDDENISIKPPPSYRKNLSAVRNQSVSG